MTATGKGGVVVVLVVVKKKDKSCNLFKFVSVLLSASVKRVGVSRMRYFFQNMTRFVPNMTRFVPTTTGFDDN